MNWWKRSTNSNLRRRKRNHEITIGQNHFKFKQTFRNVMWIFRKFTGLFTDCNETANGDLALTKTRDQPMTYFCLICADSTFVHDRSNEPENVLLWVAIGRWKVIVTRLALGPVNFTGIVILLVYQWTQIRSVKVFSDLVKYWFLLGLRKN